MCTICGCGTASIAVETLEDAVSEHAHSHSHAPPGHHHEHTGAQNGHLIDFSNGMAGLHIPGMTQQRTISVERDILSKNGAFAQANRARLRDGGIFALNLVSSPGSGKTSLLVRAIADLKERWPLAVIEGDQQTSRDAERIRAAGAIAVQINTGKGCHLDAHMVGHALDHLVLVPGSLLFIENVGNLVCPAAFDLGEAHKVVVLSVTEGEDKPPKYPDMFAASDLMLVNKSDLLAHLAFDMDACLAAAFRVNPRIQVLTVSAHTGEGLAAFYAWIEGRAALMPRPT
jgi:hydrogenase nickel incorporation protein HypB